MLLVSFFCVFVGLSAFGVKLTTQSSDVLLNAIKKSVEQSEFKQACLSEVKQNFFNNYIINLSFRRKRRRRKAYSNGNQTRSDGLWYARSLQGNIHANTERY